ncbi:MAG: hypothetical protein L6428_09375, partial [Candidatus Aminicenantes bacterium]|nr:hypothetical protein [Candidatus Aminicenantes bacterium]
YLNGSNPCDIISSPRWLWFLLDIKTHYTLFYQGQRGFFIYFDGESGPGPGLSLKLSIRVKMQ